MKKSDLKRGMVVENYMGCKMLVLNGYNACGFISGSNTEVWPILNMPWGHVSANDYTEDLTLKSSQTTCDPCHIVKVYEDYTCTKVLWERKEKPVLTEDEKVILRNLDPMYKYIARDGGHEGLVWIHPTKPRKNTCGWSDGSGLYEHLKLFNHLFKFVKWEDEQPYSIKYLLGESEVNE